MPGATMRGVLNCVMHISSTVLLRYSQEDSIENSSKKLEQSSKATASYFYMEGCLSIPFFNFISANINFNMAITRLNSACIKVILACSKYEQATTELNLATAAFNFASAVINLAFANFNVATLNFSFA